MVTSKSLKASRKTRSALIDSQVSALQMAEEVLWETEEKCHAIIDNIEDGYYEVDLAGNFTFFNDAMLRISGYCRDEFMGMNNRRIMDEYNARQVFEVFNRVYQTGLATRAFDWELIHKDGSKRFLEVSVSLKRDLKHCPVGFMGIARDITTRKLMEETLRESEEKYRTIIENIEDGYYEVDLEGNFTFFNDAMLRITGYCRDELMGMNNRRIMDAFKARQVFEVFSRVYQTGLAAKALDWELIRADGAKRFIEVSVTLKRDIKSRPVGFMGIARDITDRQKYLETLESRERELEIKTRSLEEVNTALKVLLQRREEDKLDLEQTVINNLNEKILPYLERAKTKASDKKLVECLDAIGKNLRNVTSTFTGRLSGRYSNLTATEVEVAGLVKMGKSTKEVADLLNMSSKTVEVHRANIRKKLGIANQKASLRTHLLAIR